MTKEDEMAKFDMVSGATVEDPKDIETTERVARALHDDFHKDTMARRQGDTAEEMWDREPDKDVWLDSARAAIGAVRKPTERHLPPLFAGDDWLWVIQTLDHAFSQENGGGDARRRMDRIVRRLLDYRAEDLRSGA